MKHERYSRKDRRISKTLLSLQNDYDNSVLIIGIGIGLVILVTVWLV
jgi:hypothetical protein